MIAAILRAEGLKVVRNVAGANLRQGLATTLLLAARGTRVPADIALLEVDEGAAPREIRDLSPRVVLVTNLFRDQLDRYGELAQTARKLADALRAGLGPDATLVLNADDPLVAGLGEGTQAAVRTFGIRCPDRALDQADHASDSDECEGCGAPLEYGARYGSHIGLWMCPSCGRQRPTPDLEVTKARLETDLTESVECREGLAFRLRLPGLYNVANAAAAALVAEALGVRHESVTRGLESTGAAFGRLETVAFEGGKTALLMLVKNPAGLNEVIRLIIQAGETRPAVLALNDNTADGHDVSWIWDADLEGLAGRVAPVYASGIRAYDMALRLKYADLPVDSIRVIPDVREAVEACLSEAPTEGQIYVLPTYTAMTELRQRLVEEGRLAPFWQELEA